MGVAAGDTGVVIIVIGKMHISGYEACGDSSERSAAIMSTARSRQLPLPSFRVRIGSWVPFSCRATGIYADDTSTARDRQRHLFFVGRPPRLTPPIS